MPLTSQGASRLTISHIRRKPDDLLFTNEARWAASVQWIEKLESPMIEKTPEERLK